MLVLNNSSVHKTHCSILYRRHQSMMTRFINWLNSLREGQMSWLLSQLTLSSQESGQGLGRKLPPFLMQVTRDSLVGIYIFSGLSHEEMVMYLFHWEVWVRNYWRWRHNMVGRWRYVVDAGVFPQIQFSLYDISPPSTIPQPIVRKYSIPIIFSMVLFLNNIHNILEMIILLQSLCSFFRYKRSSNTTIQ